jgi:molecular chaperone DnaJ
MLHVIRSLTKRQREILQLYVDDLEGRTTVQSQPSPASPSPEPISDESRSNNEESQKDTAPHDNGTASFTHPLPLPESGWMSRALNRIRGLIGF